MFKKELNLTRALAVALLLVASFFAGLLFEKAQKQVMECKVCQGNQENIGYLEVESDIESDKPDLGEDQKGYEWANGKYTIQPGVELSVVEDETAELERSDEDEEASGKYSIPSEVKPSESEEVDSIEFVKDVFVKSIKGNELVVGIPSSITVSDGPNGDEEQFSKTFKIQQNVKIEKRILKTSTLYNREIAEHAETLEAAIAEEASFFPQPVLPYSVEEIVLSEIKQGDMISIFSTSELNKNGEIGISKIHLLASPEIDSIAE